jgi:hypothetical protein
LISQTAFSSELRTIGYGIDLYGEVNRGIPHGQVFKSFVIHEESPLFKRVEKA